MESKSTQKRNAKTDLLIITAATAFLPVFVLFHSNIKAFANDQSIPILIRAAAMAIIQFVGFGLGPAIVMIHRKEKFRQYGLVLNGLVPAVLWSLVCCLPSLLLFYKQGILNTYLPFHTVWIAKDLYAASFPINIIGFSFVALAWGFWEGFSYVVLCEKINVLVNKTLGWLSPGAIFCGVFCLLIHGAIGITPDGILDGLACFILITGMLTVKEKTGNAWGCVLIFLLFWNAI